jgi:hypothetical protein
MPNNYPPLARLSSNIDDRRDESMVDMLSSYVRGQLTPEKIRMVMAHPMLSAIERANLINAQNYSGGVTPLGSALGVGYLQR